MNSYEAKQEARRERYEELAHKARRESQSAYQRSSDILSPIPMGQPILIGHHSEKRHRKALERADNAMRRSVEADKKAAYYRGKAAGVGRAGISSDDPEAIEKLKAKLTKLEDAQEHYKAINKIVRAKPKNQETPEKIEQLMAIGGRLSEPTVHKFFEPDFCGRIGIPAYTLQNNNANMQRIRERIAVLEKAPKETTEQGAGVCRIVRNAEENRIQLIFSGIPPEDVRSLLKQHGFRWSRYNHAWQRHLTNAGIATVDYLLPKITELMSL